MEQFGQLSVLSLCDRCMSIHPMCVCVCFHCRCSSMQTAPGSNTPPWRWIPRAPLTLTCSWTPPNRMSTCWLTKRYGRQIVSFQPPASETNAATHNLSEDYTFTLTNIARMTVALPMKVYSWAVCFMRWIIASGIVLTANQKRRFSARCSPVQKLRSLAFISLHCENGAQGLWYVCVSGYKAPCRSVREAFGLPLLSVEQRSLLRLVFAGGQVMEHTSTVSSHHLSPMRLHP